MLTPCPESKKTSTKGSGRGDLAFCLLGTLSDANFFFHRKKDFLGHPPLFFIFFFPACFSEPSKTIFTTWNNCFLDFFFCTLRGINLYHYSSLYKLNYFSYIFSRSRGLFFFYFFCGGKAYANAFYFFFFPRRSFNSWISYLEEDYSVRGWSSGGRGLLKNTAASYQTPFWTLMDNFRIFSLIPFFFFYCSVLICF